MSEIDPALPSSSDATVTSSGTDSPPVDTAMTAEQQQNERQDSRRWWIKLFLQPLMFLACGILLFAGLGVAQRWGWISGGDSGGGHVHSSVNGGGGMYICPMMCTPPQAEPGRCPVCAMELVPASSGGGATDSRSIRIDPATRRIANIQTVSVSSTPITRTIRAIGELNYDEGSLKTISAYVDGRLDKLYADYTGAVVKEGDHLALVYSPRLYTGQVELLLARKARDRNGSATQANQSGTDLYQSAKERLVLLGVTEMQIEHLEQAGRADSRLYLCAPISGTVIEKLAVEGQYVKEGDAIYKLADLSTVWLMLRLFPEDAAAIRYGQKIDAEVQSLPGRKFTGRVAFIDPNVDPKTRTVGVRVVIPNNDGLLRVGDYAKATIDAPLAITPDALAYDPDLAYKWISPHHPHIIAESAGACPICGADLVPAAEFGFTDQPIAGSEALVVPRDAVLMAGNNSVVYVETEPGRFEIRRVVLGPHVGNQIVIRSGVKAGEQVATRGNFLIDSQMQLAGNPSLIDPLKAQPSMNDALDGTMIASLAELSPDDRELVQKQKICPVTEFRLGPMGVPKKVDVNGTPVFICCEVCRKKLLAEPDKYLARLAAMPREEPGHDHSPATDLQWDLPPIGVPQIIEPEERPADAEESSQEIHSDRPTAKRNAAGFGGSVQ